MSDLWYPGKMHPGMWDPQSFYGGRDIGEEPPHLKLLSEAKAVDREKMYVVKAKVQEATYHKEEGCIAVQVELPDGTSRAVFMHKGNVTFHGKKHTEVSEAEVDRQMRKTADLFRLARGRSIKVQLYESHLKR